MSDNLERLKKKNRKSLERMAFYAILFAMLTILVLAIIVECIMFVFPTMQNYKREMNHEGEFAAAMIDQEYLAEFSRSVTELYYKTPEEIRADQSGDAYLGEIIPLLDERFADAREVLKAAREHAHMENVFLSFFDEENERLVMIVDGNVKEKAFLPGQWISSQNGDIDSLDTIDIIQDSDWFMPVDYGKVSGWTATNYLAINDANGNFLGYMVMTVRINDLADQVGTFIKIYVPVMIIMLAIVTIIGVKFVRKEFTGPINGLAQAAREYTSLGKLDVRDDTNVFSKLDIKTGNEIEELWDTMVDMEKDVSRALVQIRDATAREERIATELDLAKSIQLAALPTSFINNEKIEIFARMTPAKEVGGDFYDFFMIDDDHLAMVIADVSGKGVPAALFMMISKTLIKNRALQGGKPSEILKFTNDSLIEDNINDMFVTIWIGILDTNTGIVTASSAGHEYPFYTDLDGEYQMLQDPHGVVCGAIDGLEYEDYTFRLPVGGRIFVYTDGVAEAQNEAEEMFGLERITDSLNSHRDKDPSELVSLVKNDVDAFAGGKEQFDDITMLSLWYKGC